MPIPESFRRAEESYTRLKQQLSAGQITQDQFRDAVEGATVQDARGRIWRLGADSGKWYVNEQGAWLEELPTSDARLAQTGPKNSPSRVPMLLAGCVILFCLLGFAGLAVAAGTGLLNLGGLPFVQPTRLVAVSPIPSVVFAPSPERTLVSPTEVILPVTPSATAVATLPPPTLAPTATIALGATSTVASSLHTATTTPSSTLPAGFFVTGLRVDPPIPRSGQNLVFWVTFTNNTAGSQAYRWKVYIFREKELRRSLGETALAQSTVAPGKGDFRSEGLWKTQVGQCENFMVRVVWVDNEKRNTTFTKPDGTPAEFWFTMCP